MIEHINCIDANYAWLSFFAGMFIGGVIIAMIFAFTFGLFTWVEKKSRRLLSERNYLLYS